MNSKLSGDKDQKSHNNPIINIIIYLVLPFIISIPLILVLSNCYYHIQSLAFSSENSFIFIYDNNSLIVLVAAPIIFSYLFIIIIRNKVSFNRMKNKIYIWIALIIFFISAVFLSFDFFYYIDINNNGISVSNGVISGIKHYDWDEVENVKVFYNYGYKSNIDIYYNIYLHNGRVINLYNSHHFFDNIIKIDSFIKKENIKIIRSKILSKDKIQFERQFEGKGNTSVNRLNVLMKIFE